MTNKESLREKFWKDCKDKKLEPMSECEQIDMMWDFFWNEMQKEREETIKKIKRYREDVSSELGTDKHGFMIDAVLAIIKQ